MEDWFSKEVKMKLSAPKVVTFWVSVALAALGLLAFLVTIPFLSGFAFWIVLIAFIILLLGTLIKGM